MALILKKIYKEFHDFSEYGKDCLLDDYFLMGSPLKIVALLGLYLYFIKSLGPKLMENRKPFQINNILIVYNIIQVILNGYLALFGTYKYFALNYDIRCLEIQPKNSFKALLENRLMYYYYMVKILDLLDTIFFVMRKKYNQISFLHLYHHIIIAGFSYVYTRYIPGGQVMILGLVNCYVHAVMYFYYFLTAFKPELKSSIWWKKHITQMQIFQFIFLMLHFGHPLIFNTCNYPMIGSFIPFIQNVFMLLLFGNFYFHTYIKKPSKKLSD